MIIYALEHTHEVEEDSVDRKSLAIFSSRELAEEAIARYKPQEGFCDFPDGFHLDEYVVDEIDYEDGFDINEDLALIDPPTTTS